MRLSVNVWTPELDAFQAQPFQKGDFKRYLVNLDPEELIEESRNAWRCIGKVYLTVGIQTCQCSLLYGLKLKPRKVLCILCKKLQVLKITLWWALKSHVCEFLPSLIFQTFAVKSHISQTLSMCLTERGFLYFLFNIVDMICSECNPPCCYTSDTSVQVFSSG